MAMHHFSRGEKKISKALFCVSPRFWFMRICILLLFQFFLSAQKRKNPFLGWRFDTLFIFSFLFFLGLILLPFHRLLVRYTEERKKASSSSFLSIVLHSLLGRGQGSLPFEPLSRSKLTRSNDACCSQGRSEPLSPSKYQLVPWWWWMHISFTVGAFQSSVFEGDLKWSRVWNSNGYCSSEREEKKARSFRGFFVP